MNKEIAEAALNELIKNQCDEKGIDFTDLKLNSETNLLENGLFDSLGLLQLIAGLEDKLGIEIDLSEEDPEEFTQYGKLVEIISRY